MPASDEELELPEKEFTYLAGSTDRPFHHFTGRWQAIRPRLAEILQACGSDRPLRIVDLGSCNGFFALHAAHQHPEADIVAVEGSVGIGNGTVGTAGGTRQILATEAVQTHLRWIQRLALQNCFVAPEVWDFIRVCELASLGRPICDVMFLLSVVHHIDGVSVQQYTGAGLSRLDGTLELLGKLLTLAPRHFVELPNKPWLAHAYDVYGTQRAILQAAAKASGLEWDFKGPIFSADWFGLRELWILEAATPMPPVDVVTCPFPLLYRGEEQELSDPRDDALEDLGTLGVYDDHNADFGDFTAAGSVEGVGFLMDRAHTGVGANLGGASAHCHPIAAAFTAVGGMSDPSMEVTPGIGKGGLQSGGRLVDPGLMLLSSGSCGPVEQKIGEALSVAPTALLIAHLTLRDAINEAEDLLRGLHSASNQMIPPRASHPG